MTNNRVPEDSVLRRHYMQMQQRRSQAGPSSPAPSSAARPTGQSGGEEKGFLGRLLDRFLGGG